MRLGHRWTFLTPHTVIFEYPFCWILRYYERMMELEKIEFKEKKTQLFIQARLIGAFINGGDDNVEYLKEFQHSMEDKPTVYHSVDEAIALLGGYSL